MPHGKNFSHRHNSNGTVDSICHQCFITVATEPVEVNLATRERAHACNPWLVEWYHLPARQPQMF